jgi:hypothetical protein
MDEHDQLLPQGLTRVQLVEFDGDRLTAVILEGEGVAVPVREYCGALGLDVDAQSARLREHEVLSRGLRVVRVRIGDRMRSVVAILHKYVPFWLATITPGLVKEEVREKLVRYQVEVAEILAGIYGGTAEATHRTTDQEPIDPLRQRLSDAIREVRMARDALPAGRYQDALAWLRRKADELLPNDPEALLPQQESLL